MTLAFDLYWSFRSPYSYLVTDRIVALERDFDVTCNLRVVYPIAVRQPDFFANNDPLWITYFYAGLVALSGSFLILGATKWIAETNIKPIKMILTRSHQRGFFHIFV